MKEREAIDALEEHKKLIDKEYLKTRNSKAIEVVLNVLKEKDKTIEKLRKDNTIFALEGSRIALKHYIENNYIPVQKIKDIIEKEIKYHEKNILDIENITMLKGKTAKEEAKIEFNKYTIVVLKEMLQELLEGRK